MTSRVPGSIGTAQLAAELPHAARILLRGLGAGAKSGTYLLGYLLFEPGFARALMDI